MKKALREEIYDIPSELLERVFDKIVEYIGYDEFADYLNYEGMGINEDKDDDDYFDEVESTFCEALKDDPLQVIDTLKDMGYLAEDEVVELESILYDEDPIEVDDAEFEESIKTNKKSIREAKFEFYKKGDGKIGVKAPKNVSKSSKVSNKIAEAAKETTAENGAEVSKETKEAGIATKNFFKEVGEFFAAVFKWFGKFVKKIFTKKEN